MINTQVIKQKDTKTSIYPDRPYLGVNTKKNRIILNQKSLEYLGFTDDKDFNSFKVAVIREYDGYDIIIGKTNVDKIPNTSKDGTYKTSHLNKNGSISSKKNAKILINHFNLDVDKDEYIEFFLTEKIDENVYSISNVWKDDTTVEEPPVVQAEIRDYQDNLVEQDMSL